MDLQNQLLQDLEVVRDLAVQFPDLAQDRIVVRGEVPLEVVAEVAVDRPVHGLFQQHRAVVTAMQERNQEMLVVRLLRPQIPVKESDD